MNTTFETFALAFNGLILGLALIMLIILVKEWAQHLARQFWPELSSAGARVDALDVEAGWALESDIKELSYRVSKLEACFVPRDPFSEYRD